MLVRLDYGQTGLTIDLPADRTLVVEPSYAPAAANPRALLDDALRHPVRGPRLHDIVRRGQTVAISMCDGTRAQPRDLMIPAVLEELDGIIDHDNIVVLVACGTHRANTTEELREMLGDELLRSVRVVNHDARDSDSLVWMGMYGLDVPVWLNRHWVQADIRITTGFVEPHFFAGFSGGPKLAVPGLAGLDTVLALHDARRIRHPKATWGVCEGNPVHDDIRAIVKAVGRIDFGFDVCLNRDQEIVAAFAGELFAMHRAARETARQLAMRPVPRLFDVVVTTNAGFPLDQNLYQAVKGLSAAFRIVKSGGTIVCAAECRDGFPSHGSYLDVLKSADSPHALLQAIEGRGAVVPDQWQAQIQARIQSEVRVVMYTSYLSDESLRAVNLAHTKDIERTVRDALAAAGPEGQVCVLPQGPQTIPYLSP